MVAEWTPAEARDVENAISAALAAKTSWESTPFEVRAAVMLRAAERVSTKYRYQLMASTMLGQSKNIWQAEIDAAAETCDLLSATFSSYLNPLRPDLMSNVQWKYFTNNRRSVRREWCVH